MVTDYPVNFPKLTIGFGGSDADSGLITFNYSPPANRRFISAKFLASVVQTYDSGADVEFYMNSQLICGLNWGALKGGITKSCNTDISQVLVNGSNTFDMHYHIAFPEVGSGDSATVSGADVKVTTSR